MFFKNLAQQTKWVLFIGVIMAGIAFVITWKDQHQLWEEKLDQEVDENTLILQGNMEVIERELKGVVSLYNSSESVSRDEFKTYVGPILENNKFIQRLEWIIRISDPERKDFEEKLKPEFPGSAITEWSPEGGLVEAGRRDEYFPVHFVEPYYGNEEELGLDLAHNSLLLQKMQESRDNGKTVAVTKFVQERENRPLGDMVIMAPVFDGPDPAVTVDDRRARLKGFIRGIYRIDDMMDKIVKPFLKKGMSLVVFDGIEKNERKRLFGELIPRVPLEITKTTLLAGRTWLLVWQGSEEFLGGKRKEVAYWAGGSVLGIAVFIAIIFEIMASQTRQVENQVKVRTEELTKANEKLTGEITARSRAEKGMRAAKDEAELANRAKSTFLANMSHEIRTPMNAIMGYTQILGRDRSLGLDQQTTVEKILNSGDHLLQIINDILDISKIEAGKMELYGNDFDLSKLIKGISPIIQPRCEQKQLNWTVQGLEDKNLNVHGDEIKLKQILINLLGNAVKFTDSGRVMLKVNREKGDLFRFEVSDTGLGIPKNFQKRVFAEFQQESDAVRKGGTGLGLAIVKRFVDLMDGELVLESEPGQGSKFTVILPLPPAEEKMISDADSVGRVSWLAEGYRVNALVVDDTPMNRDALSKILVDLGVEVVSAENGKEAVERVHEKIPDVIFMDMRMPVMNGMEAIERIKADFPDNGIKIVVITASALKHQKDMIVKTGCDDFIAKPFRVDRIVDCLTTQLGVEFEYEEKFSRTAEVLDYLGEEFPEIHISEELYGRLKESARLHNITDLKNHISELESLGPEGQTLSRHMRPFVVKYNMQGILEILKKIQYEPKV